MDVRLHRALRDVRRAIADVERLLASGDERLGKASGVASAQLSSARGRLVDLERATAFRARRALLRADRYAHERPWQAAGVGVAVGAAVALAACLAVGMRRD
jgi:ElaB/YqjD/DUF883 family membrane-anchored ribosome-binding protein